MTMEVGFLAKDLKQKYRFQWMGWAGSSISLVLLISAGGLELFAQQGLKQYDMTIVLLALYLASWSYVMGLVGLVFFSVWWPLGRLRVRVKQAAISRYFPAEPGHRHLEKSKPEIRPVLQPGVASGVPSRLLCRDRGSRNRPTSTTRVA